MIWILCQLISVAENMKKCNWWDSILNCRSVSRTNKFPHSMKFCSDNSGTVTFHNDAPRRSNNFVNHNTKCYFPCFKTFRNWLRSKKRGKSFRKNFSIMCLVCFTIFCPTSLYLTRKLYKGASKQCLLYNFT